jgi:hypothetical protein
MHRMHAARGHGPHFSIGGKPYTYPGAARKLRKTIEGHLSEKFRLLKEIPETPQNEGRLKIGWGAVVDLKSRAMKLTMFAKSNDTHVKNRRQALHGMTLLVEEIQGTKI